MMYSLLKCNNNKDIGSIHYYLEARYDESVHMCKL